MVRAGAGAVEDLEASLLFVDGSGDELFKFEFVDEAGAGAGHEEAVGFNEVGGELVDVVVFAASFFVIASGDELWRIGEDNVPLAAVFDHSTGPAEGVGVGEFDLGVVDVGVSLGHGDGLFIEVDGGDFSGSGFRGVDAEGSGVAAEIEDAFAFDE